MKTRSGLGSLITTIILLFIGGVLIYGLFNAEVANAVSDLMNMPLVAAGVGAVMILSVFLHWFGGLGKKKKTKFIDFQSDDGSVGISTKAIQDFIERVGKEFAAVKSIQSQLIQDKGALDIAISVRVLSGNKIPELSQVLTQRVRESVRESLGLEEIRNITIKVSEIVGEPPKHATEDVAAQ